jgi:hypothetical protein
MTPKEKAKELVKKFINAKKYSNSQNAMSEELAKQCALIAVDEIIISCLETTKLYESNDMINSDLSCQPIGYYEEVKQEIELL